MKLLISAACLCLVAAPALAADQPAWLSGMVMKSQLLSREGDKGEYNFEVKNNNPETSGAIEVFCDYYDADDNNVGSGSAMIGYIKPGKLGKELISIYSKASVIKSVECVIAASNGGLFTPRPQPK